MAEADQSPIPDDAMLWRRIPPASQGRDPFWVFDPEQQRVRPVSGNFDDSSDGSPLSMELATDDGDTSQVLSGHEGFYLVALTAAAIRACGLEVLRDPTDNNPRHVAVVGPKTKGRRSRLAAAAIWVIAPLDTQR